MSAERERDRASGGGAEDVAAMASKAPARTETSGFRLAQTTPHIPDKHNPHWD